MQGNKKKVGIIFARLGKENKAIKQALPRETSVTSTTHEQKLPWLTFLPAIINSF